MMRLQDQGLVHRDIKPKNIVLTRAGAKLLDFNIASRVGDLAAFLQKACSPYRADRFPTAVAMRDALAEVRARI